MFLRSVYDFQKCIPLARSIHNLVKESDVEHFRDMLDSRGVLVEDIESYNSDWTRKYKGKSSLVLRPSSADEVSSILKYCNKRCLAVVPQGGNTSLNGAPIALNGEIILNLQRMNQVTHWAEGVIHVQAGMILQNLEDFLSSKGFAIPYDLGSKGSCMIGGNLSTNVGGLRVIRYGHFKKSVTGLKVVLADGTVLDGLSSPMKNNTGYDLKQLFFGSEGTLGVVTDVAFTTPVKPRSLNTVMLSFNNFNGVIKACQTAKSDLSEIIYALEYLDGATVNAVVENLGQPNPFSDKYPYYFIVQTAGMNEEHDRDKVYTFLSKVFDEGICDNGVVAENEKQAKEIFALRENAYVGLTASVKEYDIGFDVSLDTNKIPQFTEQLHSRLSGFDYKYASFGHMGDGDYHFHVVTPEYCKDLEKKMIPFVFQLVASLGGSISAETGIGIQLQPFLHYNRSKSEVDTMKVLKKALDPNLILNPNKIFLFHE